MKRTVYVVILSALVPIACTSVQSQEPTLVVGSFPDLGVRANVNVGEVMVSKYDYLSAETASVRERVPGSVFYGRDPLPAGSTLVAAVAGGRQIFCQPPPRLGAPCFADRDSDGQFDQAFTMNAYGAVVNSVDIDPVAYRSANQSIQDGFKYELLYQGVDRGVVRIAYREYTDNLARPAYSQDLTYTLNAEGETMVRFRDVVLRIHEANNNQISFTVESGF